MNVDEQLLRTIEGAKTAHRRLAETLAGVDDSVTAAASALPEWSVGHVLTHIARNAESHTRILRAAQQGLAVEQYAGGYKQRSVDIEEGAARSAAELTRDVVTTAEELERVWADMDDQAWERFGLANGRAWPCRLLPFHRWREVEVHHVDLGLDYSPRDWPEPYVDLELGAALADLPNRLQDGGERRDLLGWLFGRREQPSALQIRPWLSDLGRYHRPPPGLGDDRVVTIFRSRLRTGANDYAAVAKRMLDLAAAMPGFLEAKTFAAEDGERVTIVTFASDEAQAAWRDHPEHCEAQARGRTDFYDEYCVQVCAVTSQRRFSAAGDAGRQLQADSS